MIYNTSDYSQPIGGINGVNVDGYGIVMSNFGHFYNIESQVTTPVVMYLKPDYPFNLTIGLDSNSKITMNVDIGDTPPSLHFVCHFYNASGTRLTASNYSVDKLIAGTTSTAIDVVGAITMNSGTVNIGATAGNTYSINIGTASSGARAVAIGNGNTGSSVTISGIIETPTSVTNTVTMTGVTGSHNWSGITATAERIGRVCCITIAGTLNAVSTMSAGYSYEMFTIGSPFITSKTIVGACSIEGNTIIQGSVSNVPGTGAFHLVTPIDILANGQVSVAATITYIA
jgi:hypothetical protein